MKGIILPGFCNGAIEGINFLLNEYNELLDSYNKQELENAKAKFEMTLEENKSIRDIEGTEEMLRLKGFKWAITLYGKLFVSKDIEKDLKFSNVVSQIDEEIGDRTFKSETKKATR